MSTQSRPPVVRGQNPRMNGFALIFTNDYEGEGSHLPTLKGARVDGQRMLETMELLNFETRWEHNATATLTRRVVRETVRCQYLPNYKRLAFVFSGHGTTKHYLYTQDGKQINFHDIMKQFNPDQSPHIGAIPKLFFIDACRGSLTTQPVLVTKGGHDVSLKVPEQSNFLVAYSTMPDHRAHESRDQGGIWMSILAEKLKTTDASVLDVLTKVNTELCREFHTDQVGCYQQPELVSRLNDEVHLLREAKSTSVQHKGTAAKPKRSPSATKPQLPRADKDNGGADKTPPKAPSGRKTLITRNTSKYATCSTSKEKILLYCSENNKPEPRFRHNTEGRKYTAEVYVARTCGWVAGDAQSTVSEAEEKAAEELAKKLQLF